MPAAYLTLGPVQLALAAVLLLVNLGLDEVANPRLRRAKE